MKTFTCLLLGLFLSSIVFAQEEPAKSDEAVLSAAELEKLVAPIALYPDSLIALILPASTTSADVVLAARFLTGGGDVATVDNESWSDSVRSLAHFPTVVKWMDENLAWTRQIGDIFLTQPAEVMNAIQRVRAQAKAAGLLADTAEQQVVMQGEEICIVPARADVIYVPYYDPEVLWTHRSYYGAPFITFGIGLGVGNWLFYDCDWPRRTIWMHTRAPGWVYRPNWHHPVGSVTIVPGAPWRPSNHARPIYHSRAPVVATRVHVDEGGSGPSHDDSHRHDVRPASQTQVWQNKGRTVLPVQHDGPSHTNRIVPGAAPAVPPAAPATLPQPVNGRQGQRRDDSGQTPPASSSTPRSTPTASHGNDDDNVDRGQRRWGR